MRICRDLMYHVKISLNDTINSCMMNDNSEECMNDLGKLKSILKEMKICKMI